MAYFDKAKMSNGTVVDVQDTKGRALADSKLDAAKTELNNTITTIRNDLTSESNARADADSELETKINNIAEKLTGAILTNENTFINAAAAGMPASGDVSTFLNQLMSENPGACIFIPAGTYQAANTISVTAPVFVCLGTIQSTAAVALDIAVNECRVYVYRVNGQSTTDAVKLSGAENGRGRCTVNVDYISGCGVGFHLYDNTNGGGVLRNKFSWNYMDNMGVGILLETGALNSFVNQNEFFGGGIEATCAIRMKGSQTDPFNGNVFYNVSFEESTQAVNLQNAQRNVFRDFRMYENTERNSIVLDAKCESNYFYGASATAWNQYMVNDKGINFYYGIALKNGETTFSTSFRSGGEAIFSTPEQYVNNNKLPAGNPDLLANFYAIDINNNDVIMPAWFSIEWAKHPVFLNVISVSNNRIMMFNGSVIANSNDASGSSGVRLETGWYILITSAWLVKLN